MNSPATVPVSRRHEGGSAQVVQEPTTLAGLISAVGAGDALVIVAAAGGPAASVHHPTARCAVDDRSPTRRERGDVPLHVFAVQPRVRAGARTIARPERTARMRPAAQVVNPLADAAAAPRAPAPLIGVAQTDVAGRIPNTRTSFPPRARPRCSPRNRRNARGVRPALLRTAERIRRLDVDAPLASGSGAERSRFATVSTRGRWARRQRRS